MRRSGAVLLAALALGMAACGGRTSISPAVAGHSTRPSTAKEYRASLAYVRCMRTHGVPQPDPDRSGDIHLTPADERRMRLVGHAKVRAADKLCFNLHLKGVVSTKPLSAEAKSRAIAVLRQVSRCMHAYGYSMGRPVVGNMSQGRAFFGFDHPPALADRDHRKALGRAQHTCEQRVGMARKIDEIIRADRGPY